MALEAIAILCGLGLAHWQATASKRKGGAIIDRCMERSARHNGGKPEEHLIQYARATDSEVCKGSEWCKKLGIKGK